MRKFNLRLSTVVLVLLLVNCLYGIYLLRRPLFVQGTHAEAASWALNDGLDGAVLNYRIGRNILLKLDYEAYFEHYKDGSLIERRRFCSGPMDRGFDKGQLADLYLAFGTGPEPGACWYAFGNPYSSIRTSFPYIRDDDYQHPQFIGPKKIRLQKNKVLTFGVVGPRQGDQHWASYKDIFDNKGVLKPEALQYGDVFLLQFEFTDRERLGSVD